MYDKERGIENTELFDADLIESEQERIRGKAAERKRERRIEKRNRERYVRDTAPCDGRDGDL